MIRVAVAGAAGRMGQATCEAVEGAADMELVAVADPALGESLQAALEQRPEVVVDFTRPQTALPNALACLEVGVHVVIGTTGFDLESLRSACARVKANAFVAPNFAVGAVLMMRFAAQAARFFESAEIIELHHANKMDAPSGTALRTASMIAEARDKAGLGAPPDATKQELAGARGATVDDVHVHSVRLSGLIAHQEVLLGGHGETLTIRHDSLDRASFMPGVLLAVRGIENLPTGLTVGIEPLQIGRAHV